VVREEVRERLTAEKAIREGLWTVDKSTPVRVFNGYSDKIKSKDMEILYPDEKGDVTIEIRELDRIVLQFEELRNLKGWMRVGERLKRLPVGSSINGKKKEFLWMTGPAFYGEYRLVFTGEDIHGDINVKNILIRIAAKY
jgi:antibiotic biosynthesis monooxygenase (ABM) superfamily enzyme